MLTVVDYGLGNLRSVRGAFEHLGQEVRVSQFENDILNASKLVLPGVGAFGDGIANLRALNLIAALNEAVLVKKTPILGICLGAQLFATRSFEFGEFEGLGWIEADVVRLKSDNGLRVPHVGWNDINQVGASSLFRGLGESEPFYFVHSYYIKCKNASEIRGVCEYGISFPAVVEKENIFAWQCHPEKSQQAGLKVLENFILL